MVESLSENLHRFILNAGADFAGFAKIPDKERVSPQNMPTAISIGIAYKNPLAHLTTQELHEYIASTKTRMIAVLESTKKYLHGQGYKTWVPQISETLPNLSSVFSHKTAATMSGLGWIGKNSIFISKEYGCGSRLATVFTDVTVKYGAPVTKSQCGPCNICIKACPCRAIKGTDWYSGISRDELLDPWTCKKYRDSFKERLGFSHPCCLCIISCPLASL